MEDNSSSNSSHNENAPSLCSAGCGFYGSKAFNNMCSQCFKAKHKTQPPSELTHTKAKSPSSLDDTSIVTTIEKSRKHLRSPSPIDQRTTSAPVSSTASPATLQDNKNDEKPIQVNKSKCFSCRLKVPLAKQATNKCRCGYVFCDKHRYPDRHDCDVDYAKMDREILARNNPKLNERPKGGRSFQRIDSL